MVTKQDDPGFGVYVHWPFCQSKCPYCDFNSHASESTNQSEWRTALLGELDWVVHEMQSHGKPLPRVSSIFFGGGTPSLMDPATTQAIIQSIKKHFKTTENLEITLEANPSSVEAARFQDFRQAGVNRLSLGVQSFDDRALKFLGRNHDHRQALAAIDVAATTFDRYSFDLMYALPDQTDKQWRAELATALQLAGEHISLYQLTIEPGTKFARDGVMACDEVMGETMYHTTAELLGTAGMTAYEISNYAKPGAQCGHNLTYWRGGGYLGIGPGAHGRLNRTEGWQAHHRIHNPARWLSSVQKTGHGTAKQTPLSPIERRDEMVMMGLRLSEGISAVNFMTATGLTFKEAFSDKDLRVLTDGGFLEYTLDNLRATPEGLLRLNGIIARLLLN